MSANWDSNQERTNAENLLYQRLIIFLIVFSVLVIGAVNTQRKILFLSILSLGVIICWVLTFIVIRTAKRIDNKSGGRIVRLLLGYLVPVFCSSILTAALIFGSAGFADPYLFYTDTKPVQLEKKVNEAKKAIEKLVSPETTKSSDNFKSIETIIAEEKAAPVVKKEENSNQPKQTAKTFFPKQSPSSKYFKSVDSVMIIDKPTSTKKKTVNRNYMPLKTDTVK